VTLRRPPDGRDFAATVGRTASLGWGAAAVMLRWGGLSLALIVALLIPKRAIA
jgi:hypothetical protein